MEFNGEALQCRMIEDGVVEMTFDLQNESVNKFNRVTMEEYRKVVSLSLIHISEPTRPC
mgnify:CR=1 FL=1